MAILLSIMKHLFTSFKEKLSMLTEQEAQDLINKFIRLRTEVSETQDPQKIKEFKHHERMCVEKFDYLVTMKTGRYKSYNNYEDLKQEGRLALVNAMVNYDPTKGNAFWWFHRYIDTRISRSANLHTTIRYPLKVAKEQIPHKEASLPIMIETKHCPDKELELSELFISIENSMNGLSDQQKEVIGLAYGFHGEKPLSVNKICKKLNISRSSCLKSMNTALLSMKEKIKI